MASLIDSTKEEEEEEAENGSPFYFRLLSVGEGRGKTRHIWLSKNASLEGKWNVLT